MNREIKFRVWNKLHKQWEICDLTMISEERVFPLNDLFKSEFSVFQQYTGLKDKSGSEIYEGDIVKVFKGNSYVLCVVKYEFLGFHFEIIDSLNRNEIVLSDTQIKIVGNIFKNPELLVCP